MGLSVEILDRGKAGEKTRRHSLLITPDSAWADAGEAITPNQCGMSRIITLNVWPNTAGAPVYDAATGTVKLDQTARVNVQQTRLVKADFTDVTTTGTVDTAALPAGSTVLSWLFVCDGAFSGDTSATTQLGVAGDLDRFSAQTTGSIFATGTVGSAPLAADVHDTPGAAITPRFTVTTTADFTNVSAGASGDLYILYIPGTFLAAADVSATPFYAEAIGV